ncbi:CoA pyrophosphatase [Marinomonas sp. 15G1-11]|uniref:CoA pyrophosphatase n=1 Tax=Marinomonas phaeophyticola TaxID=3004091 RepID=A0ABT4JWY0_9GAMM|nr:CoA pyrophosphatase [Marinomonas sp. 15G1-11]MCZ2722888.1 CoA pyrophosphatase [Marinomonas sp. 15G1-11]
MSDVKQFLNSPPLSPDIGQIRSALDLYESSQIMLNPGVKLNAETNLLDFKTAAVLIPIWKDHEGNLHILLTQRAKHLRNHPGQIAFPGGQYDDVDTDLIQTALRETHEEVGLPPNCFQLIGELGDYLTISGFCVKPIIAEVTTLQDMTLALDEVESAHWVPLDYLLTPTNYKFTRRNLSDIHTGYFEIQYQDITIWGVTAGILYELYQALDSHIAASIKKK